MLTTYRELKTEFMCGTVSPVNQNHSVYRVNPNLIFCLGSTSEITAGCHLEGGEGGSLFLKTDIFKEQVPKLSIGEKYGVRALCGLFGTAL